MTEVVPLADAREEPRFGAKATGLGAAVRSGLPVPPGYRAVGLDRQRGGRGAATRHRAGLVTAARSLAGPLAVRSSAATRTARRRASPASTFTLLNVPEAGDVPAAIREIWWSANSDSAITYRQRVGLFRPSVGVVVQSLLDPDVAGVMFTQNPINEADERLIEASWGSARSSSPAASSPTASAWDRAGAVRERTPGLKKIAIRAAADGGTVEESVARELVGQLCLDDDQLAQLNALPGSASSCTRRHATIEWAFAGGGLPAPVPRRDAGRVVITAGPARQLRAGRPR